LDLKYKFESPHSDQNTLITCLLQQLSTHHSYLWSHLSINYTEKTRLQTYALILVLENILNFWSQPSPTISYTTPDSGCRPSLIAQIVYQPKAILNHYLLSLQSNYYYPLDHEPVNMSNLSEQETASDTQMQSGEEGNPIPSGVSIGEIGMHSLATTAPITVEHSLDVISDLISEIEADDPPSQLQDEPILATPNLPIQKHHFSLYKKNSGPIPSSPQAQLKLFESFFNSIKKVDQSAKILPIRTDIKIYPLSTSDQLRNLEQVGVLNYFKPNKRSQKTLSGYFYVQTKLDFDSFQGHQALNTWLMQFGYHMMKSSCQTADMVRIGFLTRIRSFTLRCDFHSFITASPEWRAQPFHFRLYYDAVGAKGRTAHVLMIDVDRPNIEYGLKFFQK
jgi:hypothetical protein